MGNVLKVCCGSRKWLFFQKEKALGQPEGGSSMEELSSKDITGSKQL